MNRVLGIAVCVLTGAAWAQNDAKLTPRQIFDYGMKAPAVKTTTTPKTPPVIKTKPIDGLPVKTPDVRLHDNHAAPKLPDGSATIEQAAYAPLAVRYSILQLKGKTFQEVDADTEFHSKDRIRVKVEANGDGYLYIVMGGSSGQWQVLFPSKDIAGGDNRIERGKPYTIPPADSFLFDETAGVERVSLVLSRTPQADLEKLIYAAGDPTRTGNQQKMIMARNNAIEGTAVDNVREKLYSRDLVFEKSDTQTSTGNEEKAVYVASPKGGDAPLFVDLKLTHK
jgi:hypothetical protein